ncbi:TetR family transcriptional regulator [Tropicibacter sp. R16_0]|uniref:TetR/AcrR family transcriptional regulator n=1 Tax=Tropicibacter sp. R16_0 TaxID=2821102 RepID=UPI001AD9AE8B|nr:TetR family transcriptional regulator [Tropicibacter sp. R16_0]MBO9450051.1 TetR family transcriptional regulator [Tropicibacter sp. R16_0]
MKTEKPKAFAELKRRVILDAAMAEFEAHGPDKASMRAIAKAAGVTTGAIYSMFEGKDDLYGALLAESLERLKQHVAAQVAKADGPMERVAASVEAFYSYYADRLFEVQLGMHSFGGIARSSLGRARDQQLNAALLETLDIIGRAIADAAPHLSAQEVEEERNAVFGGLIGVLTLAHTRRAQSVGTSAEAILATNVTALLARLGS